MNRQSPTAKPSPRGIARALFAALLVAALVGACQQPAVATSAPAPTEPGPATESGLLVLGVGQSAEIGPATTLRFNRIVSDSRCPADVQCVWAGEVRIALTLTSPAGSADFELAGATANSTTVQSFLIEMAEFGPCEPGPSKAASAAECASLRVTESAEQ